ncbi:MAG: MerR family transcriptional regulator [Solirubrobacterales bacterium]|nr:MerR family transcriptional regulator [Solirubrobacterales bacterium]
MDALTIHEAASTTGWSARMLRYVERAGLIEPRRSAAGYRLYGAAELQQLRTLRELLDEQKMSITEVAFALRLRRDVELSAALAGWFDAEPARPADVPAADWLLWEQDKHQKLLAAASRHANELMETTT